MRPIPMTASAGVAIMAAAMLIAPFMDMFAKLITETASPGQAALGRFAAQSLFLLPVLALTRQWGRPRRVHLVAGLFLGVAILCINAAFAVMPIPNAIAIFFVEPLILTLLSAAVLGEKLGWRRLSAVGLGLVGAMVVIRPNFSAFGGAALLPVAAAFAFAAYLLIMRTMSQRGARVALQFWIGVVGMGVLALAGAAGTPLGVAVVTLTPPGARELALMAAAGLVACVAHQMLSAAFARAEAGALAPLQYLEIVSATLIGWFVWHDFPDRLTWAGTALIVAAGVYVFHREARLARSGGPTPGVPGVGG